MPINFPNSPTNGQVYTVGSRSWVWDSANSSWNSTTAALQGIQGLQGVQGIQGVQGTQGIQGLYGDPTLTVLAAKTTNYTLADGDQSDLIPVSSASTVYITIPTNATVGFLQGTQINLLRQGAGAVYIQGVTTTAVSVQGTPGLQLRAQYSAATAIKLGTDHWVVVGDLSP